MKALATEKLGWIIVGEPFAPKYSQIFKTEKEAEEFLTSLANEWKAAGSSQDPRNFYSIEKNME